MLCFEGNDVQIQIALVSWAPAWEQLVYHSVVNLSTFEIGTKDRNSNIAVRSWFLVWNFAAVQLFIRGTN